MIFSSRVVCAAVGIGACWSGLLASSRSSVSLLDPNPRARTAAAPEPLRSAAPAPLYTLQPGSVWSSPAGKGLPAGLDITVLAVNPASPLVLFAGTKSRGLFRSADGGSTWTPVAYGLPRAAIRDLAVDPSNASVVYVAATRGLSDGGIFRSADGGLTFNPAFALEADVASLAIDPQTPWTVYAGTGRGVFKTTDAGRTWQPTSLATGGGAGTPVAKVVVDPAEPSLVYAISRGGLHRSTNGGTTWELANRAGETEPRWRCVQSLVADPGFPTNLFAAGSGCGGGQLYKSKDNGQTWTRLKVGSASIVAGDPLRPGTLYAGGSAGVFRSTDDGQTWRPLAAPRALAGINALALDPRTGALFAAAGDSAAEAEARTARRALASRGAADNADEP